MKKVSGLLLVLLSACLLPLPAQESSHALLLAEEIYNGLLDLEVQITNLNESLRNAELSLSESAKLQNELEALLQQREMTLKTLSMLVDEQKQAYKRSLFKWQGLSIVLGVSTVTFLTLWIIK